MEPHHFFLQLVVILFAARLLGEIVARLKIPPVLGELLAGVLIGPSILGWIEVTPVITLLANIGIVLLLFEVGLETDLGQLKKTGMKPFLVAMVGVILPFILGIGASLYLYPSQPLLAVFIGSTLTATSIGITLRILQDLKQQNSIESQIVLGAAVIDDIIGVVLLAFLYEFVHPDGDISFWNAGKVLVFILIFLVLAPIVAKIVSMTIRKWDEVSEIPGLIPSTIVSLLLLFAWLAHDFGAPELLGGFAAGLALSRRFFLPLGAFLHENHAFADKIEHQMRPIIHLFSPIFFVVVGASLNLKEVDWTSFELLGSTFILVIVAFLGKFASGFAALGLSRASKYIIGFSMVPRGEVGLIFAEVGKQAGLLSDTHYAAVLLVVSITTLFAPFMLRWGFEHKKQEQSA